MGQGRLAAQIAADSDRDYSKLWQRADREARYGERDREILRWMEKARRQQTEMECRYAQAHLKGRGWRVCCNNNSLFVLFYKCCSSRHSIYCGVEDCRLCVRRCQHHGVLRRLPAWQHSRCWEGANSGGHSYRCRRTHVWAHSHIYSCDRGGCWRMGSQPVSNRGPLPSQTPPPLVKPGKEFIKI